LNRRAADHFRLPLQQLPLQKGCGGAKSWNYFPIRKKYMLRGASQVLKQKQNG
jgi:hypothetical protein